MFFRNTIRSGTLEISPSIGIIVTQLKNCVEYYKREKHSYDGMLRQKNALPASSLDSSSKQAIFVLFSFLFDFNF